MVVGVRNHTDGEAYRTGHLVGNKLFTFIIKWLFGAGFRDVFSGYRALSRPFVKSFPSVASGFEIETEMSVHALQLGLPTAEVVTTYSKRKEGSESKLRTYSDGARILIAILQLLRHQRPFLMFGVIALMSALASVAIGLPVILEFLRTGLVPRLPSAVLAASLMVIAAVGLVTGIILDSVAHAAAEQRRLFYLSTARRKDMGGNDNLTQGSGPVCAGRVTRLCRRSWYPRCTGLLGQVEPLPGSRDGHAHCHSLHVVAPSALDLYRRSEPGSPASISPLRYRSARQRISELRRLFGICANGRLLAYISGVGCRGWIIKRDGDHLPIFREDRICGAWRSSEMD